MSKLMLAVRVAVVLAVIAGSSLASSAWAASDSATYGYDSLGRVTTMTYANGTTITYSYDAAGNRTSVTTTCGSSGC